MWSRINGRADGLEGEVERSGSEPEDAMDFSDNGVELGAAGAGHERVADVVRYRLP